MDSASETKLAQVNAALASAVRTMAAQVAQRGGSLRVISGFRSYAQQLALWNARASNRNPVAAPGTSKHEQGLAVDLTWSGISQATIGQLGESLGLRWGGRFNRPDPGHFELVSGASPDASGDGDAPDPEGPSINPLWVAGAFAVLLVAILIKD